VSEGEAVDDPVDIASDQTAYHFGGERDGR
jgi:hypothetical protein